MPNLLEGDYKVEKVVGTRKGKRGAEALVRWKGYGHTGDTWEPFEHVEPRAKLTKFLKSSTVTVDLQAALHWLRDGIARQLTSRKIADRGPSYKRPLTVDAIVLDPVAEGLLEMVAGMVTSRVSVERGGTASTETLSLSLFQLDDVAELVMLQATRPEAGTGALRIHCGVASHEDMLMVIPPLQLYYSRPKQNSSTPTWGRRSFTVLLTTVAFNGRSGGPRWPMIAPPKGGQPDERLTQAEQAAIVAHARAELGQPWAPQPVRHRLRTKGWHKLPASQWALSAAQTRAQAVPT